ncbi:response regulator [Methanoplanus sp. FWC-SCC4]|uniref:Response regulator n=1 Tax=Methanochimaera problematica TaxID=2609417 RepID=A0AA97I367_9EURY|nr:response regulator [Methanoplanus sp. FWC-SCC4]WOF15566.1 response regulator [Methanoplanus sp. FWC-SCC4]
MNDKKILLMDDEAPIIDILSVFLGRLDFEVYSAGNGTEALRIFKEEYEKGNKFSLSILDVSVPGDLGAKELIGPLKEIDPDIKVIISSGDSVQGAMENPLEFGFSGALKKPFRSADLKKVIDRVLNQ